MPENTDVLSEQFIIELFKACFDKRNIFEIVHQYMKLSFLRDEVHKKFWKKVIQKYTLNQKFPSIGTMALEFRDDEEVVDFIVEIKKVQIEDYDAILISFQEFLKQLKFLELNDSVVEAYRTDREKSYQILIKGTEEMASFSIMDKHFTKVFSGFNDRNLKRLTTDNSKIFKVPTGIDLVDAQLRGGPETSESVLWLGESGIGKSQLLTSIGIMAARSGHKVAHFQAEGTEQQCMNRYDAAWTGTLYHDMKSGLMTEGKFKACQKIVEKLSRSDIYVEAFEKFGSRSLVDIRSSMTELNKNFGHIPVAILDYLELIEVGDGMKYGPNDERHRQRKIAKGIKELAMEFNCVFHTATQASSISKIERDQEDFYLTRYHLSEDKGKIQPFDIFLTINQSAEEKENQIMRLYADKFREYGSGQIFYIANNFSVARFYDRKRTMNLPMNSRPDKED